MFFNYFFNLGISSDDEQKIEKIVEKHIQGK